MKLKEAAIKPRNEGGPAAKRRKISDEVDLFGEIIADIYDLLGAQRATDLVGLSQAAE